MNYKVEMNGARLLPFSYSRLSDYERCPLYAFRVHVMKQRGPQSPHAARGERMHKEAEQHLKLERLPTKAKTPPHLWEMRTDFENVREARELRTELKFGVTDKWTSAEFFGNDVWGRGVYDVWAQFPTSVVVIDHKTGKVYPSHEDQLRLYAVVALALAPALPRAVAEAWYLDLGPDYTLSFELRRREATRVRKDFETRVIKMVNDKMMKARPNDRCKWCHFAKRNGGDCVVGGA